VILAVASGKGGTGKTTVAAALSRVWANTCLAVDVDVEAPNLDLFLNSTDAGQSRATVDVPVVVNAEACNGCGACARICAFKGILAFGDFPVAFPELCHSCGGCLEVCRRGVLGRGERELGIIRWGYAQSAREKDIQLATLEGRSRIGETMSPPLIKKVRSRADEMLKARGGDMIIDAPPGTSCPAMTAVRDVDAVLLVAEPTPFGCHDLDLAVQAFRSRGVPLGVVVNRAIPGNHIIHDYAREMGLPILGEIPYQFDIAQSCAGGVPLDAMGPDVRERVETLMRVVQTPNAWDAAA